MDYRKQYERILEQNRRMQQRVCEMTNQFSTFLDNAFVPELRPATENGFGQGDIGPRHRDHSSMHSSIQHMRPRCERTLPPLSRRCHQQQPYGLPLPPQLSPRPLDTLSTLLRRRSDLVRRNSQLVQDMRSQCRTLHLLNPVGESANSSEIDTCVSQMQELSLAAPESAKRKRRTNVCKQSGISARDAFPTSDSIAGLGQPL